MPRDALGDEYWQPEAKDQDSFASWMNELLTASVQAVGSGVRAVSAPNNSEIGGGLQSTDRRPRPSVYGLTSAAPPWVGSPTSQPLAAAPSVASGPTWASRVSARKFSVFLNTTRSFVRAHAQVSDWFIGAGAGGGSESRGVSGVRQTLPTSSSSNPWSRIAWTFIPLVARWRDDEEGREGREVLAPPRRRCVERARVRVAPRGWQRLC